MFGGCASVGVFEDSLQGDSDLTVLKSVSAQGSWSALLPDSNIRPGHFCVKLEYLKLTFV